MTDTAVKTTTTTTEISVYQYNVAGTIQIGDYLSDPDVALLMSGTTEYSPDDNRVQFSHCKHPEAFQCEFDISYSLHEVALIFAETDALLIPGGQRVIDVLIGGKTVESALEVEKDTGEVSESLDKA